MGALKLVGAIRHLTAPAYSNLLDCHFSAGFLKLLLGSIRVSLADLPSMEILRGTLLGMLNTPATSLVRILNTPASQLARVLQAKADKG